MKPYKCRKCGRKFRHIVSLDQHYHAAHENVAERPRSLFECTHCNKGFGSEEALRQHNRDSHEPKIATLKAKRKRDRPQRIGKAVPCPVHGLKMETRRGPFGVYYACPLRPACDIIGDWSEHDHCFHVSTQADRNARKLAHATFDPLWQSGHMSRRAAYAWLAERLEIAPENAARDCHMKHFLEETALKVVRVVREYVTANQELHDLLLECT